MSCHYGQRLVGQTSGMSAVLLTSLYKVHEELPRALSTADTRTFFWSFVWVSVCSPQSGPG